MRFGDSEGRGGEGIMRGGIVRGWDGMGWEMFNKGACTREVKDNIHAIQYNFGTNKGWTDNKKEAERLSN